MATPSDAPTLQFDDQAAFEAWLEENHATDDGFWMKLAKAKSQHSSVSYAEAVESALCFGWIDGQKRSLDDDFWLQRFTPRRKRSIWSKVNRAKAEALTEAGRMRPSGIAEVERAKADGRWEAAYDPPSQRTIPDDLQAALDASATAPAAFAALKSQERYSILFHIQTAKRPETRAKRIAEAIAALEAKETT